MSMPRSLLLILPLALAATVTTTVTATTATAAETRVEEMSPGMAEAYVRGIQQELAVHGYKPGPADGAMGPRTRAAIRQYQRDAKLPVTGRASKELLDHLKFATPKVNARTDGLPPELVLDIQGFLAERGYYRGPLDGLAGPKTRDAVRRFQKDAALPVTGRIDRRLLGELRSADPAITAERNI